MRQISLRLTIVQTQIPDPCSLDLLAPDETKHMQTTQQCS